MSKNIILFFLAVSVFYSCKPSLKPEDLYGEWKYIKVENPKNTPPDSISAPELAEKSPSITFSKTGDLHIIWGGEQLSTGKFKLDGNMIRYTEDLADSKKREFPFIVREISDKEIIFETMTQQFTRVTARKIH